MGGVGCGDGDPGDKIILDTLLWNLLLLFEILSICDSNKLVMSFKVSGKKWKNSSNTYIEFIHNKVLIFVLIIKF